jgi:hypothetical protein
MRPLLGLFGTVAFLVCVPVSVHAQALVGEANSLSAQFGYTFAPSGKIISSSTDDDSPFDNDVPNVPVFVHIVQLGAQYTTPVPGLAVEASIPLVGVQLGDGAFMHYPVRGEYDDGDLHWTLTDFRGGLRYQVKPIEEYLGLAFSAGGSIPVTDYPTQGFAYPDQHLKALHLGVAMARTFDPVLPNLYFDLGYEYSMREKVDISEETEQFNRDHSDVDFQLGYFLPANFSVAAAANLRLHHGGVQYADIIYYGTDVIENHDVLGKEDILLVGGDIGYDMSDDFSVGLSARFFTWGKNTRNQNLFGLSAQYRFF